jgi:hypothetical protein
MGAGISCAGIKVINDLKYLTGSCGKLREATGCFQQKKQSTKKSLENIELKAYQQSLRKLNHKIEKGILKNTVAANSRVDIKSTQNFP